MQDPSVTGGGPGPPSRAVPEAPRWCIVSITLASHLEDAVDVWVFAVLQPPTPSPVPTAASRADPAVWDVPYVSSVPTRARSGLPFSDPHTGNWHPGP